eukprot:2449072-Amphidinium_carterae.2
MWGCATDGLTGAQVHRIRCRVVRTVKKLPMRASPLMCLQVDRQLQRLDPALVQHVEVFTHWCQELKTGRTPDWKFWAAAGYAAHRLIHCRQPWARCSGPTHLLLLVCTRLGWSMQSPTHFIMHDGLPLDVMERSVEYVCECVRAATTRWTDLRHTQMRFGEQTEFFWEPVQRAYERTSDSLEAYGIMAAASAQWTQDRLYRRGLAEGSLCQACGAEGTVAHRVFHCLAWEDLRVKCLPMEARQWACRQVEVDSITELRYKKAWLDKDFVEVFNLDEMEFVGEPEPWGTEVFTDGSASDPSWRHLRRAGWGVAELDPQGGLLRGCFGPVPLALAQQQCVGDAEAMAVAAALLICPGMVHVHTDCAEVYKLYNALNGQGKSSKVRGHWWSWLHTHGAERLSVTKVKAHKVEPSRLDDFDWKCWRGNAFADELARRGAQQHLAVRDADGLTGAQVAAHLMSLASWVGRQARALVHGEVHDCENLPKDGLKRVVEEAAAVAPKGRKKWVPPE